MKRIAIVVGCALFAGLLGFAAAPAIAESVTQVSETMSSVAKDQTVDSSVYLAGESVDVQGIVKGDVYCAAQTVTIRGTVEGDVLCAGATVTIDGVVRGDVRAAGANIVLKASVEGSVTLAGASVVTDSASKIGRDATITGSTLSLSGSIARDAVLAGSTIILNGSVGRDVRAASEALSAAPGAKIGGNLAYVSENTADISSGVVAGTVQHTVQGNQGVSSVPLAAILLGLLIAILVFTVSTVCIVLAAPRYVHRISDGAGVKQFIVYFLVGLVGVVVAPVLGIVLLVTVVGFYAAIVLGLVATLGLMIGASLVAYRLGRFMLDGRAKPLSSALVGSLALGILSAVPFIGWLIMFASAMIGFGMVIMGMKSQYADVSLNSTAKVPVKRPKLS